MSETKDMTGALFKAREKRSERSPDYTGELVVGGVTYRLSGWVKESQKKGIKYISLALREREDRRDHDDQAPF